MKIWIYWFKSNSWINFHIHVVLNKNWKIYWSEQSFTGLGPKDRCSSWGLYISNLWMVLTTIPYQKYKRFDLSRKQFFSRGVISLTSSFSGHSNSSSFTPPSNIFIKQWELAWECIVLACAVFQHNIIKLNLPFPKSTKFLVYLENKIVKHFIFYFSSIFFYFNQKKCGRMCP